MRASRRESLLQMPRRKTPSLTTMLSLLVCLLILMASLKTIQRGGLIGVDPQRLPQKPLVDQGSEDDQFAEAGSQDSPVSPVARKTEPAAEPVQPPTAAPAETTESEPKSEVSTSSEVTFDTEAAAEALSPDAAPPKKLADDADVAELLSFVKDNSEKIHRLEMPAYVRFLSIVEQFDFQKLTDSAKAGLRFNELYQKPQTHRGELIHLELNVRRIIPCQMPGGKGEAGKELYEVWGSTDESKAWLYCMIVPTLPAALAEVGQPNARIPKVPFSGYFFKLQGYHSGQAAPGGKPLVAPLLIGRFGEVPVVTKVAPAPAVVSLDAIALCLLLLCVGILVLAKVAWHKPAKVKRPGLRVVYSEVTETNPAPGTATETDNIVS